MNALVARNRGHELAVAQDTRILRSAAVEVELFVRGDAVEHEPAIRIARLVGPLSQQAQCDARGEPRHIVGPEIGTVAAQLAVVRACDPAGTHRQQVQVADELEQIGVRIDQQRLIALLKQMTRFALAPVHAPRVLAAEPLHEAAHRHVGNLHDHSDRVDFPTERVHAHAAPN